MAKASGHYLRPATASEQGTIDFEVAMLWSS